MGHIKLHLVGVDEETMKSLQEGNDIEVAVGTDASNSSSKKKASKQFSRKVKFDDDGEFATPAGQIPLSRMIDFQYNKQISIPAADHALLEILFTYQRPDGSSWKLPFIRCATNHVYDNGSATVWVYVYFTRLIFELIADPAIKKIISRIEGRPFQVRPTCPRRSSVSMFHSKSKELLKNDLFKFSLAGLLKYAENDGYPAAAAGPDGLKVEMYEFQRSTYQWMLDQERTPGGLNGRFWETWLQDDGMPMYYFEEAGELRLQEPPSVSGGLLCEEMGLGKTVEILALILGNPKPLTESKSTSSRHTITSISTEATSASGVKGENSDDHKQKINTKATLIVVPSTLLGFLFILDICVHFINILTSVDLI